MFIFVLGVPGLVQGSFLRVLIEAESFIDVLTWELSFVCHSVESSRIGLGFICTSPSCGRIVNSPAHLGAQFLLIVLFGV